VKPDEFDLIVIAFVVAELSDPNDYRQQLR
jgi:hypothetical protein